jgi:hypothetical protein
MTSEEQTFESLAEHWLQGVKDGKCSVTAAATWIGAKYKSDLAQAQTESYNNGYAEGYAVCAAEEVMDSLTHGPETNSPESQEHV